MQAPDTKDLKDATDSDDHFSKAVRHEISRSRTVEKKTYTITIANIDYIENIAKEIAKSRDSFNSLQQMTFVTTFTDSTLIGTTII